MKKGEAKPEGEGTSTATRRHKGVPEDRVDEESDGIAGSDSPRFVAEIGSRRAATRRHEEAATRRHKEAKAATVASTACANLDWFIWNSLGFAGIR